MIFYSRSTFGIAGIFLFDLVLIGHLTSYRLCDKLKLSLAQNKCFVQVRGEETAKFVVF